MERIKGRYLVNEITGCWEWSLFRVAAGYGRITVNKAILYAHRYSYSIHYNTDITGLVIRHKCDNPCCINPEHLIAGTQKENVHDISLRGRRNDPTGERNYASKFSDFEVEAMRIFHEFYGMRQYKLSVIFGMSRANVNQIIKYQKRMTCRIDLKEKHNLLTAIINKKNTKSCLKNL